MILKGIPLRTDFCGRLNAFSVNIISRFWKGY